MYASNQSGAASTVHEIMLLQRLGSPGWVLFAGHGKIWNLITNVVGNYTLQDLLQATSKLRLAAQDPSIVVLFPATRPNACDAMFACFGDLHVMTLLAAVVMGICDTGNQAAIEFAHCKQPLQCRFIPSCECCYVLAAEVGPHWEGAHWAYQWKGCLWCGKQITAA